MRSECRQHCTCELIWKDFLLACGKHLPVQFKMDEADTKKAVEMALSILQKCHSKMQEEGANSSDSPATTSEDKKSENSTTRPRPRNLSSEPRPNGTSRMHNPAIENFR